MNKFKLCETLKEQIDETMNTRYELEECRNFKRKVPDKIKRQYYNLYNLLIESYFTLLQDVRNCEDVNYEFGELYELIIEIEDYYINFCIMIVEIYKI